jgi:hypothetical protein
VAGARTAHVEQEAKLGTRTMIQTLMLVGIPWFFHVLVAGLPVVVAFLSKMPIRWFFAMSLLVAPFWMLVPGQMIWPVGGLSSFFMRLVVLTFVVYVAEIVEVSPLLRKAPAWCHLLVLAIATLSVIPIQLSVPALPD